MAADAASSADSHGAGQGQGGPLHGVRVLDVSDGIAAPVAAMWLADLGADVVRVPLSESFHGAPDAWWHRNKTIYRGEQALSTASDLARTADVLVCSDPQMPQRLGLGAADAVAAERCIHLLVPHVSSTASAEDPWTQNAMTSAAWGIARRQNSFSGGPVEHVYPHLAYLQGSWAAAAAIAALVERQRSGAGQQVTVDDVHGALLMAAATMVVSDQVEPARTDVGPAGPDPLYSPYRCGDGRWVYLSAVGPKFQRAALAALGLASVLEDPRVLGSLEAMSHPDNRGWIREKVTAAFGSRDADQWLRTLNEHDCPAGPVGQRDAWLDHPQVDAVGQRCEVLDPDHGPTVMPAVPVDFARHSPPAVRPRRYTHDPSWAAEATALPAPTAHAGDGPLDGFRVLDTGTVLAGPFLGMLLSSLGADVIRVEPPAGEADRVRRHGINRGKRSLAVDLRAPAAHDAFLSLVATSDVVLDNYRPGVLSRLKLDRDSLAQVRPEIISASITGFGSVGPLANRPGYDPVLQAMSGMMSAQSGPGHHPVQLSFGVNDLGAGCIAAVGVCAALYARELGRGGDRLSTTLVATAGFMQGGEITKAADHRPRPHGGPDHQGPSARSRFYATADGFIRVALPSQATLAGVGVAGGYLLSDAETAIALQGALGSLPTKEAVELVAAGGGVAVPARSYAEVAREGVATGDGYVLGLDWPDGGRTYVPRGNAVFSRTVKSPLPVAPGLGQHSVDVLVGAGVGPEQVAALVAEGSVVAGAPIASVAGVRPL